MALPQSLTTVTRFSKIVALALFVLLPFGTFFLGRMTVPQTAPQSPVSPWQTYTSTPNGFAIKYPNDWMTNETANRVTFRPQGNIADETWGLVVISVGDKKEGMVLDSYVNDLCHSPGDCASAREAESITVSGMQGKKVVNPPAPVPSQVVVLMNDTKVYKIHITLDKSFEEIYSTSKKEQIFNEMVSSFTVL